MLKNCEVAAVLPAKDIARARTFYRDVLGLDDPEVMDDENLMYRCGNGTGFLLYQTDNAGTAKNTQIGWRTDNLEAEMEELRGRGLTFEEYDFPGLKTENGVATNAVGKGAWFTDTEGNIFSIYQSQ
jgi:predicted enzyme related to lactoylglutathione lyase